MRIALGLVAFIAACKPDMTVALTPLANAADAYAHAIDELRVIGSDASYERDRFRYFTTLNAEGVRTWMRTSPEGGDELLLDEHDLKGTFGALLVSPNQRWLAWSSGTSTRPHAKSERYAVHVKDLQSGDVIAPALDGVDFSFAWSADDTLLYTKLDERDRPARVFALQPSTHHLPKLVHEEKEPTNDLLVAETDHTPALFVHGSSGLLAYRLDPLRYVDGITPITASAPPSATTTTTTTIKFEVVDAGPGGGSLIRTIVDEPRDAPSVR